MNNETVELLVRVLCATVAGGVLGFERDVARRPAGLRTHALVGAGAALFTIAGAYGFDGEMGSDPSRIAAQVVSGLGFIGAGSILRHGLEVRGLTTASTVWAAGALGITFAVGLYEIAVGGVVIVMLALIAFRPLRGVSNRIGRTEVTVTFRYRIGHGTMRPILHELEELEFHIANVSIDDGTYGDEFGGVVGDEARVRRLRIDGDMKSASIAGLTAAFEDISGRAEMIDIDIKAPAS